MKINGTSKSLALGGLIGTTVAIMYVVNAEDLDGDGFHEFVPGTGISSSQMNYNFDQVAIDFSEVNQSLEETNRSLFDLDERLGLFESAIAIDGANIGISGSISAADFYGDGSNLTNLNANSLTTGTVGSARLGSGTANDTTFLRGDGTWAPVSGVAGSGTANYLPPFTNGTTIGNSAIYQSNGNVGIGTEDPAYPLDIYDDDGQNNTYVPLVHLSGGGVRGTIGSRVLSADQRQGMKLSSFQNLTLQGDAVGDGGPAIQFQAGIVNDETNDASTAMTILSSGNVGIGTANPGGKLDIVTAAGSAGTHTVRLSDDSTGAFWGTTSNSKFSIITNDSNRLTVDTGGNVGIGTTSPAAKLDISGTSGYTFRVHATTDENLFVYGHNNLTD